MYTNIFLHIELEPKIEMKKKNQMQPNRSDPETISNFKSTNWERERGFEKIIERVNKNVPHLAAFFVGSLPIIIHNPRRKSVFSVLQTRWS